VNLHPEDYASLSKDAYKNLGPKDIDDAIVDLHGHKYKVFSYQSSASGFHATAYREMESPYGIVIAYRGTDPDHLLTTIQDASVDAIMVGGKVNPQIRDAERFTERVLDRARQQGISIESITVTGHSLGGTLAEVVAWKYGLYGQTFNAFGAAELNLGIPEGGSQVINHVLDADPVSAGGHHFGMVHHYATVEDIDSLRAAGYLDGQRGVTSALHAMRFADHSIDNFAPDADQGPSVLNAANETRAKEHAVAIAAFREDVHDARAGLHMAMQPGMPLVGLHTLAWGVEGLTAAGLATSATLEKAREIIERQALRGAHAVEQTAQQVAQTYEATRATVLEGIRTGEQVAHDVHDVVRREVVQGIHATEQVAHEAYDTTRDSIVQGAHATGKAVSQGIDAAEHAVHAATERASEALDILRHPGQWFDHPSTPAAPVHLNQPAHPDHALFLQARHGVHQLDAEHGRSPDQRSDNLAAALVVAARRGGLSQVHHVALSDDASRTFAMQGEPRSPLRQMTQVHTALAMHTPIEQSSLAWQQAVLPKQVDQAQAQQVLPLQQEQMPQHAPHSAGR
jgi:hypothetical protein